MAWRPDPGIGEELLQAASTLVAVPSVSHHEQALAQLVADRLRRCRHLEVEQIGDSVIARTHWGARRRVLLAGHLDTVPPAAGMTTRIEGDTLWGLGAVDMKGGLAVLLSLATSTAAPAVDATYVFYACEEVSRDENALAHLLADRPDLFVADAAVLAEPTGGVVEAGCQGTLRAEVILRGRRAHTARPWTGSNAVHRLGPVLAILAGYEPHTVRLDGCTYTEQLQAVGVRGGVAGNVVPDEAIVTVNFRFAPDRDGPGAVEALRRILQPAIDGSVGDAVRVVDLAGGALPALQHPVLTDLVERSGAPPRAKVGWTDAATLAAAGVPTTNFGPGDPLLAHTPDEHVSIAELQAVYQTLAGVLFE
jgi:succinyl-diaminopimelate desuccinylase